MYPEAVIFDFDGVIVDTEPIHYRSFQKILEPLGLSYSWQDYIKKYMGFDDRDAFREVFKTKSLELSQITLQELIDKKAKIFEHVIHEGVQPYPGVIELITELSKIEVPLAICSGALRSDILPILDQLQIFSLFNHIITADDVAQSKPDPASYLRAKEKLISTFPDKINRQSTIYAIEDTPAGIQSAKGAGLIVIAVTNSYGFESLTQADMTVTSLSQLMQGQWPEKLKGFSG